MTDVSVVIPTIGRTSLVASVGSVLAQSIPVSEIIVVVDGFERRDAVEEMLAPFGDAVVRVLACQHHGYPGPIRTAGLARVRTPLVAFLADDDVWEPDKLERQLPAFGPTVVAVGSNALSVSETTSGPYFVTPIGGTRMLPDFFSHNPLINSSVVCRTLVLRDVGGFPSDPGLAGVEDYVAWIKLASQGSVVIVDELLVRYRVGSPGSMSVRTAMSDPVSTALAAAARELRLVKGTRWGRRTMHASLARRRLRVRARLRECVPGRGR